jgi:hypothetical protein
MDRLWVFENKVPSKIFGPRRNKPTAEWRKLHNEELGDVYSSADIIKMIRPMGVRCESSVGKHRGDELS